MNRILLVTRNTQAIPLWQNVLVKNGYDINVAISGEEAINRAVSGNPNLIVLNEIETTNELFTQQLKQHSNVKNVPVMVVDSTEIMEPDSVLERIKYLLMPKRILIAEDDRQMAEILKAVLDSKGYQVKIAYDGAETLKEIKSWHPNLLVLDIMLPIIDGFHICQQMHEDDTIEQKPMILIISGRETEWDKNLGKACGAEEYIVKPIDNEYFLKKIQEMLSKADV
ncbi:MAG: response regulator [Endomicrobiales bacterium]|nr:response regulator [Endomicrobiales bacterium]